ncbi:MAG: cytochrome c biogenesis protein CcsA, partial [Candidatus Methylomirabilis sp.]|nr:cytochrome c biogenesis protein CcsA [Deltaproteobacteria bacterium]
MQYDPLMGKAVGTVETQYQPLNYLLFDLTSYGYLAALLLFVAFVVFKRRGPLLAALGATWVFFALHTAALALRWWESHKLGIGHAPITNLYESLVFLAWVCVGGFIIIERKFKLPAVGLIAMLFSFGLMTYAHTGGVQQKIQPLVPALQSYWLLVHVTVV